MNEFVIFAYVNEKKTTIFSSGLSTCRHGSIACSFLPVFVRNVECALDVAAVWILALAVEHFAIVFVVVQIDGTVESQQNDLRDL